MEIRHSDVWLSPEFDCCWKYRSTLPFHVKVMGEDEVGIRSSLETSRESILKQIQVPLSKVTLLSERYQCWQPIYEEVTYTSRDDSKDESSCQERFFLSEFTGEGVDESTFDKKLVTEESTSDLAEPIGPRGRRLLRRPPSPDGEIFDRTRPKEMIPFNVFKYKGLHESWPEPPSLEERLLRRRWAPSPNISLPGSRTKLIEVREEDKLWIDGHFAEGFVNEFVSKTEDGGYYRVQKKWLEGHWEPTQWFVELQQKENVELAKEARRLLEEQQKYEEILKRADSPGMNVINWGDGPVEMTKWKDNLLPVEDSSELFLLPTMESVTKQEDKIASESQRQLCAELSEALLRKSESKVARILDSHLTKKLDRHAVDNIRLEPSETGSRQLRGLLGQTSDDRVWLEEASQLEESSILSGSIQPKAIKVPDYFNKIPEEFRNLLIGFLREFLKDKPEDPLNYAINYFVKLIPRRKVDSTLRVNTMESVEYFTRHLLLKRHAVCLEGLQPEVPPSDFTYNDFEKTEDEIELISACITTCFLFENMPLISYTDIVRNMYKKEVSTGEMIMLNDAPRCMYVIEKGSFELNKLKSPEDEPQTTMIRGRGYFGENCLVDDAVNPSYVVATECGALWCINKDVYRFLSVLGNFERRINVANLMNDSDLFNKLVDEEKDKLIDSLYVYQFNKGEVIFCQETTPEGIYFILSGAVKLVNIGKMFNDNAVVYSDQAFIG